MMLSNQVVVKVCRILTWATILGYNETYVDNRGYRSGRVAGRSTMCPAFMEEICDVKLEPTCDHAYMYRTIMGECNNLGYAA